MNKKLNIQIPDKFLFLITKKSRYKVVYSGRYGYKSWSFARAVILRCMEKKTRVLCCRETMESMAESVHQLLKDVIFQFSLNDEFEVLNNQIKNKINGSLILFDGILDSKIDVKGKEGIDICWVEEAEKYSKKAHDVLYPTIRKEGSELWFSFNTTSEDAFIWQLFVVNTPHNAIVVKTYWYDYPELVTETIKQAAEDCEKNDPVGYRHIWLGEPSNVGLKIYSNFDEKVHVKDFNFSSLVENGNFYVGMDPHKTAYPATIFGCKIPLDSSFKQFDYYIYNEFPSRSELGGKLYHEVRKTAKCSYTLKQLTGMFKVLERTVGNVQVGNLEIAGRACDPYFAKGVGGSDWSADTKGLVAEWSRPDNGGLYWTLPLPSVLSIQKNTINDLLEFNNEMPVSAINSPKLFIAPHCVNTIESLKHHRDSSEKDCECETYKDFSDALRIFMSIAAYTPYRNKQREKENMVQKTVNLVNRSMFFKNTVGMR